MGTINWKFMESWVNINVRQRSILQYWLKHFLNCRFIAAAFVISATVPLQHNDKLCPAETDQM
jgi:hypothetical protein